MGQRRPHIRAGGLTAEEALSEPLGGRNFGSIPLFDPSGDAFETLHKDGKALGLPVTLVTDKDGCEIGSVEGGVKWDSAQAEALVGALMGG